MKRVLIIIVLFFFLLTCYEITRSYALFESNQDIPINVDGAKWQILVNDSSIKESATFEVTEVIVDNEPNVLENRLAPGTEGYFDIQIVPNETSVAFRFDLTYSWDEIDTSSIEFAGISETNGYTIVRTGENTYSGIVTLSDIENENVVDMRISIRWVNNEANSLIDSEYGLSKKELVIPITVHFTQYLGETLVEYSG